jgi:hypothetical protein
MFGAHYFGFVYKFRFIVVELLTDGSHVLIFFNESDI